MVETSGQRRASQAEIHASIVINRQVNRISTEIIRKSTEMSAEDQDSPGKLDFTLSHGLTTSEAEVLLKKWGRNELVEKLTPTWLIIFRLERLYFV